MPPLFLCIFNTNISLLLYNAHLVNQTKRINIMSRFFDNEDASEQHDFKGVDYVPLSFSVPMKITERSIDELYGARKLSQLYDKLMEAENLSNLDITDPPTITAQAATDLLERIYKSQAVSTGASIEMKNLLLSQSINDRIPKYLPKGTKVAHKTGELEWVKHDVGIVYGKKSDYIFVFLSETNSPKDAAETIANLSRKIFDELEARQS